MKLPLVTLYFLAVLLYLTACTKTTGSSNESDPASLTGKWNLVTDSTFEGVGYANHPFGRKVTLSR